MDPLINNQVAPVADKLTSSRLSDYSLVKELFRIPRRAVKPSEEAKY